MVESGSVTVFLFDGVELSTVELAEPSLRNTFHGQMRIRTRHCHNMCLWIRGDG